jgi:hypothetical protein
MGGRVMGGRVMGGRVMGGRVMGGRAAMPEKRARRTIWAMRA